MNELHFSALVPVAVILAVLVVLGLILVIRNANRYSEDTTPVWDDDDYDGWGSY